MQASRCAARAAGAAATSPRLLSLRLQSLLRRCTLTSRGGSRGSAPTPATKLMLLGVGTAASVGIAYTAVSRSVSEKVSALDFLLHPPSYPWYHGGWCRSLDHASVRRGYEVYKQVCAACHSLKYVRYRELVGVTHTEDAAKEEAAEAQVQDGPDEEGNMYMRPGKLADSFPSPYRNDEEARAANNGALPPDLSYIVLGREGNEDYIFSILTGYVEPAPAGLPLGEGQHYNPYFAGGAISMAQALFSEMIEYDDGTPATQSQMAKDVTTFLKWCGEPEFDTKARLLLKTLVLGPIMIAAMFYFYKKSWAPLKSMKLVFKPKYSSGRPQQRKAHLIKKSEQSNT